MPPERKHGGGGGGLMIVFTSHAAAQLSTVAVTPLVQGGDGAIGWALAEPRLYFERGDSSCYHSRHLRVAESCCAPGVFGSNVRNLEIPARTLGRRCAHERAQRLFVLHFVWGGGGQAFLMYS